MAAGISLGGNLAESGILFNAFVKYSESEVWKQIAKDRTDVSYVYNPDKNDLYIWLQISPSNTNRYSFQGNNSGGSGFGYTDKDAFVSGKNAEIVKWVRDELEFFIPKKTPANGARIYAPYQNTIPLTLLPDGTCESIRETFEPPVNDSTSNVESTIKIRPVEPYSLKTNQPILTYGKDGGSGGISMDAVWNEAEKGFDVKFTYNRISDISLKFQSEVAMATEKY